MSTLLENINKYYDEINSQYNETVNIRNSKLDQILEDMSSKLGLEWDISKVGIKLDFLNHHQYGGVIIFYTKQPIYNDHMLKIHISKEENVVDISNYMNFTKNLLTMSSKDLEPSNCYLTANLCAVKLSMLILNKEQKTLSYLDEIIKIHEAESSSRIKLDMLEYLRCYINKNS